MQPLAIAVRAVNFSFHLAKKEANSAVFCIAAEGASSMCPLSAKLTGGVPWKPDVVVIDERT
jgi:hypothetical protein